HVPPAEHVAALTGGSRGPLVDRYDASIRTVDHELSRLLDALPDDAWVVLTSDHGEELTEARRVGRHVPAGTRHGHTLHQELLRVPLVVWGPGVRPGRVSRSVSLLSVAPTLLAIAGVEADLPEPAL